VSITALPTRAGGAQIVVALSAPGAVDVRILNIAGRPVRTLCRGRACAAGTNTLLWNARSDAGVAVPSGTYLVEITARGAHGAQTRAIRTVRLSR
jgi:flagellar hook assembly protein FlgD